MSISSQSLRKFRAGSETKDTKVSLKEATCRTHDDIVRHLLKNKLGNRVNLPYVCTMNWDYINGFFDADGSITLTKSKSKEQKTVQVSFHNCEISILEEIRSFIFKELNIKGNISLKKSKNKNHSDAYDLKYTHRRGYTLIKNMSSIHPKKSHRIKISERIQECTPKNGKYTNEMLEKRLNLEKEFFKH